MANRIAITKLNASTMDIINTIRANATSEYQSLVPEITDVKEIPRVGEVLYGYPLLANQFITSLINRVALVRVKSAVFNNTFAELKKGYLEFGETIEEVFVNIAKAREFNPEKGEAREHKRTIPDVRTAFHTMNWRVQYPITLQHEDLRQAFTSINGVTDLVTKIVDAVYTAAEYDEFLLFKYLMIKAISHGKMFPVSIGNGDMSESAIAFRGTSNKMTFMKKDYNATGVTTATPKADQYIFMDSDYNARYDVGVLAGAFNMDKADFIGKLKLIDEWTSFDNDRFSVITEESDMIEPVTDDELALMRNVKAVLVDKEWFQIYDNLTTMTEAYVSSGMYWNYFYNVWKTVSSSPFSNAIVFVVDGVNITAPETFTVEIVDKSISESATIITLGVEEDTPTLANNNVTFVQDNGNTEKGIAIHRYGAIIFPANETTASVTAKIGNTLYTGARAITVDDEVGTTVEFNKNT